MRLSLSAVRGNCHFLAQGVTILDRLTGADFITPGRPGWASVGTQFRHILDHYRSFLLGWADGRVDYEARGRDLALERDPREAALVAGAIREALERLHVEDGDRQLMVQMDAGGADGVPDWRPSTVGRELQFLASHTVHYYALIRLLLLHRGIETGADLGMAPATEAWQGASGPSDQPAPNAAREPAPSGARGPTLRPSGSEPEPLRGGNPGYREDVARMSTNATRSSLREPAP